jgi:hypothetical protein
MWHAPRFLGPILFSPRDRGPTGSRRSSRRRASRPRLEALEGRALLATLTGFRQSFAHFRRKSFRDGARFVQNLEL